MFKAIVLVLILVIASVPSFADEDLVTRELDEYARANDLSPANISTTEDGPSASINAQSHGPQRMQSFLHKAHEFEFAVERYGYKYKETVDGSEFMNTKGFYNGLIFSYTFRPIDIDSLAEVIDNMFRVEARFASGRVDYTGSGTWDGLKDTMYELRGIVGHEYNINPSLQFMPYIGLGFRYLNNGAEAMPARIIDGQPYYSGYNRESKYYYIPVGIELYKRFPSTWGLGAGLEYDFWRAGRQISHLEDMVDLGGVNAGYDPLYNKQNHGFGWRGSLKIDKTMPRMKISVEPYYRYWKVEDSEVNFLTKGGALVPVPGFPGYYEAGREPLNTTQEIGVKMGVIF